jgi:hypothetical protein
MQMSSLAEKWTELSLGAVVKNVQSLLKSCTDSRSLEIVEALLDAAEERGEDEDYDESVQAIAGVVREVGTMYPNVVLVLLAHLQTLPNAQPFIEILPALLVLAPPSLVQEVVEQLREVRTNTLPCVLPSFVPSLLTNPFRSLALALLFSLSCSRTPYPSPVFPFPAGGERQPPHPACHRGHGGHDPA